MSNITSLLKAEKIVEKYEVYGSDIVVYNPQHKNNKEIADKYIKYMESLTGDMADSDNKYLLMANLLKILTNIDGIDDINEVANTIKEIAESEDEDMSQDMIDTFDYIFDIMYDTTNSKAKLTENVSKLAKIESINTNSKKNINEIMKSQGMALGKKNKNDKVATLDKNVKVIETPFKEKTKEELQAELEILQLKKQIAELEANMVK